MSADYKPGTLAVIAADFGDQGFNNTRAFRIENGWATEYGEYHDRYVTEVRPLVVLDPDDVEQVKTLRDWLGSLNYYGTIWQLQSSLRQMTKPPKPAEPTGLGAVVEDAWEVLYVRTEPDPQDPDDTAVWTTADGRFFSWGQVDPVRVLSDGWEPKP